jgi:D-alanyl-D-alanine carboxypeptidase
MKRRAHGNRLSLLIRGILLVPAAAACAAAVLSCSPAHAQPQEGERQTLHPEFELSIEDLRRITADEPEEVAAAALERPQYFLELVGQTLDLPEYLYLLVDKDHPLPDGYVPRELTELRQYPALALNRDSLRLHSSTIPDLLAMNAAAREAGVTLVLSSAYRSYSYQKGLYEGYVSRHGREEADRFSARPGTSQHQLGTAVDFGSITEEIARTAQGQWLAQHAWEYGFSLSYPRGMEETTGYMWEPWHFRYMSRTVTRLEREFFSGVQQYMTEFLHRHGGELKDSMR